MMRRRANRGDVGLAARPRAPSEPPLSAGDHRLGLGDRRDVTVFVPRSYDARRAAPLVVCLHGAGGEAGHRIRQLRKHAERLGAVLVAPDNTAATWDVIAGGVGPDVRRIDDALAIAFARFAIDPARVAVEGFSDGASYALTLGLANGDLFRRIFAFSPGFNAAPAIVDRPRVFISHGVWDTVLKVDCSRGIVEKLRAAGLDVEYEEFLGIHMVPDRCVKRAFARLGS